MDPNLDDELREYLRLIDATVKSAPVNHASPQRAIMQQPLHMPSIKPNEYFSALNINNYGEEKDMKNTVIQRKKPQILDDSISDWNIGSQQTTLESPKSQEDIKDLCQVMNGGMVSSHGLIGQYSMNNGFITQNASLKTSKYQQESLRDENQSCLCSLDKSQKPSRNIVVQLGQSDDIDQFITFARSFGDLQNIDRHKQSSEKIVILSYFNLASSILAFQQITSGSNFNKTSYVNDFNDFDYIDYMLISNANSFNQRLVFDYLGSFGKIMEYSNLDSKLVVRYFDVRSLKEIDRLIKLSEKDKKSFIYIHRSHFPEVEEKFIVELLKNIFIFSKENTTDIILKNARVKNNKSNNSQQTVLFNFPSKNDTQGMLGLRDSSSSLPFSYLLENAQSTPSTLINSNPHTNFFNFDENSNPLSMNSTRNENNQGSQFTQQKRLNNSQFSQKSIYLGMQQPLQNQQLLQSQPNNSQQSRRELHEICDYQNCFTPQQPNQNQNQQPKLISPTNQNCFNEISFLNEIENLSLNPQTSQKKNLKRLNSNSNNFSLIMSNNCQNTQNNNNSNYNFNNNSSNYNSNNNNNSMKSQGNINTQQNFSTNNNFQDNGQKINFLQQSLSSSSSLSSSNYPQLNGNHLSNFNSLRMSQDENPFSASSLRMSFDNNTMYQINQNAFSNNNNNFILNNNNNCNTNSNNNINNISNQNENIKWQNNSQMNCNQMNGAKNSHYSQQNESTQFMNLLNCNTSSYRSMVNMEQDHKVLIQNQKYNNSNINNNMTMNHPKYQNNDNLNYSSISQQSNKSSTIIGSNGVKSHSANNNFQVILENIIKQKDKRATIMVRNIPNRYNQEDFLRIVDINFKGLYDFVYLPMDFKNHCNIGYAFINFIDPKHIIPFYKEFNDKRWEMIRSEKVCFICYARIQGRNELIAHFKKSGVMSAMVDKSFKPLILPNPQLDLQILQE